MESEELSECIETVFEQQSCRSSTKKYLKVRDCGFQRDSSLRPLKVVFAKKQQGLYMIAETG